MHSIAPTLRRHSTVVLILVLLPSILRSQTRPSNDPRVRYAELRKEMFDTIMGDPCRYNTPRITQLLKELEAAASAAGIKPIPGQPSKEGFSFWSTVQGQVCVNSRGGGLPEFESALLAMADDRKLDPCTYDPKSPDRFAVLNSLESLTKVSPQSYNSREMQEKISRYPQVTDDPQRACFLEFIKAHLGGRPYKPAAVRTASVSDERTTPADPYADEKVANFARSLDVHRDFVKLMKEEEALSQIIALMKRGLTEGKTAPLEQALDVRRDMVKRILAKLRLGDISFIEETKLLESSLVLSLDASIENIKSQNSRR